MNYNRIPVTFNTLRKGQAPEIGYQYDIRQVLVIQGLYNLPRAFRVDFCNEGDTETKPVIGTPDGIEIPDEYLLTGKVIKAYIVLTGPGEAVQTRYELEIPVRRRPMATDVEPTPEQRSVIDQLIDELNAAADEAEQNAEDSEAWAVGEREGVPVIPGDEAYHNNAKYYSGLAGDAKTAAETAQEKAEEAQGEAETAQGKAEDAQRAAETSEENTEAFAAGTRHGDPVSSGDPAYHNNGVYYLGQTQAAETAALQNIEQARSGAVGDVDTAKTQGISAVNAAKELAIDAVNGNGSDSAKSQAIDAVQQAGAGQIAAAEEKAEDSEAWAVGTRNGVPVPSTDPAYQNNAKYLSEHIYVTLGVDDYFSKTSENPIQNQFLTPKIAIEDADGKIYIVTRKVVNGFLQETFTEVTA